MTPPDNKELTYPSGLKSAEDIVAALSSTLSVKDLVDLADAGYLPHWRINGSPPMFQISVVKRWIANNLLQYVQGQPFPIELKIMIDAPPARDAPPQIHEIPELQELPIYACRPGIYFLVAGSEVVYIGQSEAPLVRIATHIKDKSFDRAYLKPIPSRALDQVEGALIRLLKPKLNGKTKNECFYAPGEPSLDVAYLQEFIGCLPATPSAPAI